MIVQNGIRTGGFGSLSSLTEVGGAVIGVSSPAFVSGNSASLSDLFSSGPGAGVARWFQETAEAPRRFFAQTPVWDAIASDPGTALCMGVGVALGCVVAYGLWNGARGVFATSGAETARDSVWAPPAGSAPQVTANRTAGSSKQSPYDVLLNRLVDPANIAPYPGFEEEAALPLRVRARLDASAFVENAESERSVLTRLRYETVRDCARRDAKIIADNAQSPLEEERLNAVERMATLGELVQRLAYFATVFAEFALLEPRVAPICHSVIADVAGIEREYARLLKSLGWDGLSEDWVGMELAHSRLALTRSSREIESVLNEG